jgi:hypothetical protein
MLFPRHATSLDESTAVRMATTFLQYLTLPNPVTNSERSKEGSSYNITTVYGPFDVKPWEDVTWENLDKNFGNVLRQEMPPPEVKDANGVDSEVTIIRREASITKLAEQWNEKVVQHALKGACERLEATRFKKYLAKGAVHFSSNTGAGDVLDENSRTQRPDWCVYQKCDEVDGRFANLVPGDSKPAAKWQAQWIDSGDSTEKRRAYLAMQQITKYMWLCKTRYGFLISEKELVPVRLSIFHQASDIVDKPDHVKAHLADSTADFGEGDLEEQEIFETEDITYFSQNLGAPFSDEENTIRTRLEYCRIPWAEHWVEDGTQTLTVNLTLWWLPMLAIQDSSIQGVEDYLPLHEIIPENDSSIDRYETQDNTNIEGPSQHPGTGHKRKAGNSDSSVKQSKSSRSLVNIGSHKPDTSSERESKRSHRICRHISAQNAQSQGSSVAPPRRSARRTKVQPTDSFSSVASSSQTTNADNPYTLSFASSIG